MCWMCGDKRIRYLDLSKNAITLDGATIISQFLKITKTLIKLNLSNNSKREFLRCIKDNYSNLYQKYADIYLFGNNEYLITLKNEIELYCKKNKIICYFASKN